MSRQFDVIANPDPLEAEQRPYLINLQSDLVRELHSVAVAPLVPRANMLGAARLNPLVVVEGREFWVATHELFAIDRRMLRSQPVANLENQREAMIAAIDLLFTGI
jgi:toxin CcdB